MGRGEHGTQELTRSAFWARLSNSQMSASSNHCHTCSELWSCLRAQTDVMANTAAVVSVLSRKLP